GEPGALRHVELVGGHAAGEAPVEVEQQRGERELDVHQPERHAGAHPPAGAERDELEVRPPEVPLAPLEPLRRELLRRAAPRRRVPADRPRVHEHRGARRHVVAEHQHLARAVAPARRQQRRRRVQPERLLDDELEVAEVG
ncbi:Os02g0186950, partial [Oryza sativa Japonica Group]